MKLNTLYRKLFTRHNVNRQLITVYLFAVLIPFLLIGTTVYTVFYRQIAKSYEYLTQTDAQRVRSILLTTMLYMNDIYENITADAELSALLNASYSSEEEALAACTGYKTFEKILAQNASLASISLYTQPNMLNQVSDFSYFYPIDEAVRNTDWYTRASSNQGNFWESTIRTDNVGNQYWELNYYCRIPVPQSSSYAILVMTVSDNHLRNLIKDDGNDIYISVNEDPVFYSTDRSKKGMEFPLSSEEDIPKTGKMQIYGETVIASSLKLKPYRSTDHLYILSADPSALPYLVRIQISFTALMLFTVFLSALLIYLFADYFSTRIRTLRLAMHKVSNNDYEIMDAVQGDDELSAAFQDLKTMVVKIKAAEAQIYEAQIKAQDFSNQQQQMELKLLANQINPHFLYNTLETIRMKAFSEGNREVSNAIKLLGKSMRYVLNNTKTASTTLDKEMDYVATYLSIQKLRFDDRLSYTIQIDPNMDLKLYKILPLLLQPIVENAIVHGIEVTGDPGHIIIRIGKSGNDLLVAKIFDNGVGMSAETLREVTESLTTAPKETDHGVGLYNINNRILLYYGKEYGLTLHSREGYGTLVTLTIPLYNLQEEYDECTNSR